MKVNRVEEAIGQNTKFAGIALSFASSQLKSAVRISDCVAFYPILPFALDPYWEQWIGTPRSQEISQANLVLLTTLPTTSPGILDAENSQLEATAIKLFYSVMMLGVPAYGNLSVLNGANNNGIVEIRQIARMPKFYIGSGNLEYQINKQSAQDAGEIFGAIEHIYSVEKQYTQLRRGLKAFLHGLAEEQDYDRLHQFVRSLDVLILSERGKGARQFRHRCRTFALHNQNSHQILDTMYELRGRTEHLTDWDDVFPGSGEQDLLKIMNQRTRQAEALARHAFRTIFTTPSLLEHFKTNNSLKKFWNLTDKERHQLWPNELKYNLDSISLVLSEPAAKQ